MRILRFKMQFAQCTQRPLMHLFSVSGCVVHNNQAPPSAALRPNAPDSPFASLSPPRSPPVGATTGALIGAVGQSTKKVYSSCFRAGGKNFQDLAFGAGAFGAVGGSGAGATEGAQAAAAAAAGGQGESLGTVEGLPGWTLGRTWRSYR